MAGLKTEISASAAEKTSQIPQANAAKSTESQIKIEFTTRVPITENIIRKLTEDSVDIEKTYEVIKTLNVNNKHGIHGRPAAAIVSKIKEFKSKFTMEKEGEEIDVTSMMSIISNGMTKGTKIKLKAKGVNPETVETEIDEILKLCEDGEKLFEEHKITVDTSKALDIGYKLNQIDEKIKIEIGLFLNLIATTAEHHSLDGGLSESEFTEVAKQFRALANIKGIRNDILKLFRNVSFQPETNLEVYLKGSGTVFHLTGKDGIARVIQVSNVDETLIAQFNHIQISRPIDEFNREVLGLLNGSHAYEINRTQTKLGVYYESLGNFLAAPLDEFKPSLKSALKKRMQYEHHRFIGIKTNQ